MKKITTVTISFLLIIAILIIIQTVVVLAAGLTTSNTLTTGTLVSSTPNTTETLRTVAVASENGEDETIDIGATDNDDDRTADKDHKDEIMIDSGSVSPDDGQTSITNKEIDTNKTGIEHEDIGRTLTDKSDTPNTENKGIEEDDFGMVATGEEDAQAESKQTKTTPSLPRAKKPREIVVVGSKVKEVIRSTFLINKKVTSEEELEEFTIALVSQDERIEKVSLYFNKIEMDYKQPAKLFGFINTEYTASAQIDEFGRLKVQFPWWLALSSDNADEVEAALKESIDELGDDAQMAYLDLQDSVQKQQQLIQMMSNIMKTKHDTAKAAINNVR